MKEVCTLQSPSPFRLGPAKPEPIKTQISEYAIINIGKGYFGILIKNPVKKLWHIFEEQSGALIGTKNSRAAVVKMVKNDVATGDEKLMTEQIKQGINNILNKAELLDCDDFFRRFSERRSSK